MANHRTAKQQRVRKAMIAGAATAGLSGALAVVQGTSAVDMLVQLTATDTVIGIGGRGDNLSARVPDKLDGALVPNRNTPPYYPILYPASLELGKSRDVGVPILDSTIRDNVNDSTDKASIIGYSEGTLVAEAERRKLESEGVGYGAGQAPAHGQLTFTQIASPFAGNGGVFARFPKVPTFIIVDNMGPGESTRYDTHYYVNEYDPYGDFPAYFNPLSLANSALAIEYAHPDVYYNEKVIGTSQELGTTRNVPHTEADGTVVTDTYTIFYTKDLPLLAPIRQAADAASLGPYVEPGLDLVEPTLRVLIDAGYTDRTNADPATATPFRLITPPQNIIGAAQALPKAAQDGIAAFQADTHAIAPFSVQPQNRSNVAAEKPKQLPVELPKLPKLLPTLDKPKADKPTVDVPKVDALKLPKPPVLPRPSATRNTFGPLANLVKPTVVAGDPPASGKPTIAPSFGGGKPAGKLSEAVKNLTKGLTGQAPAS